MPTTNFIGKKKPKVPPKDESQYKHSFNTSVLNQVSKKEALITRTKYADTKPNDEPSSFYQGPAINNISGRISNFDLNSHDVDMLVRDE